MEGAVLFSAGIFFVALFSSVIGMVSISFIWTGQRFRKLEEGQANLTSRLGNLEEGQASLKAELKEIKALLRKNP